jgi:Ca2+-binding EF-hand superfamily protein
MLSRKLVFMGVLLSLSSTPAFSNEGPGGPAGMGGPGGPGLPFPKWYDADGDGKVTAAEVKAARAEEFPQIDADADGYLSFEELDAWFEQKQTERFNGLDADSSGTLSEAEFVGEKTGKGATMAAEVFGLADSDDDGALSSDEFRTLEPVFPVAVRLFVGMDRNNDYRISEEEYLAPPARIARRSQGH